MLPTLPAHTCPSDGIDSHGRCLAECRECGEHLICDGRYTTYCPSCDVCPDCGCEIGSHYAGCAEVARLEAESAGETDDTDNDAQ